MGVPKIEYLNENLTWQLVRNIGEIEIDQVFSFECFLTYRSHYPMLIWQ